MPSGPKPGEQRGTPRIPRTAIAPLDEKAAAKVKVPKSAHTDVDIYTPIFTREYPKGLKLDADRMFRFLEAYMSHGRFGGAALAAGVSGQTIHNYLEEDPVFADAFDIAESVHRDRIEEEFYHRAMVGDEEPIIGGRNRDEVVATVRRKSERLLEKLINHHLPKYRENKKEIDVNFKGGVLAIGAAMTSEEFEEYAKTVQFPKEALQAAGEEAIEGEYEDVT